MFVNLRHRRASIEDSLGDFVWSTHLETAAREARRTCSPPNTVPLARPRQLSPPIVPSFRSSTRSHAEGRDLPNILNTSLQLGLWKTVHVSLEAFHIESNLRV